MIYIYYNDIREKVIVSKLLWWGFYIKGGIHVVLVLPEDVDLFMECYVFNMQFYIRLHLLLLKEFSERCFCFSVLRGCLLTFLIVLYEIRYIKNGLLLLSGSPVIALYLISPTCDRSFETHRGRNLIMIARYFGIQCQCQLMIRSTSYVIRFLISPPKPVWSICLSKGEGGVSFCIEFVLMMKSGRMKGRRRLRFRHVCWEVILERKGLNGSVCEISKSCISIEIHI